MLSVIVHLKIFLLLRLSSFTALCSSLMAVVMLPTSRSLFALSCWAPYRLGGALAALELIICHKRLQLCDTTSQDEKIGRKASDPAGAPPPSIRQTRHLLAVLRSSARILLASICSFLMLFCVLTRSSMNTLLPTAWSTNENVILRK